MTATGEWSTGRMPNQLLDDDDGILSAKDLGIDSTRLASVLLAEKRQRQRELSLTKPMGLHSNLRLHDLKQVPTAANAREVISKGRSKSGS